MSQNPREPLQPEKPLQPDDPSFKLLRHCTVLWDVAMAEAKSRAETRASDERGIGAGYDHRQRLNQFKAQERGRAVEDLTLRCMQGREGGGKDAHVIGFTLISNYLYDPSQAGPRSLPDLCALVVQFPTLVHLLAMVLLLVLIHLFTSSHPG